MDRIVPITELRANLAEITKWTEIHRQPVLLTKNGRARYVLLDIRSYEELIGETPDEDTLPKAPSIPAHEPVTGNPGTPSDRASDDVQVPAPDPEKKASRHGGDENVQQSPLPTEGVAGEEGEEKEAESQLSAEMRAEEDRILREPGIGG